MDSSLIALGCIVLVAFFLWVMWLCISSVEKTQRSWINSDFSSIVILGEKVEDLFMQISSFIKSSKGNSMAESLVASFFKKRWRTIFLVVSILSAWYVWPTPYKQLPLAGGITPQRENRFTKEIQYWDRSQKKWK